MKGKNLIFLVFVICCYCFPVNVVGQGLTPFYSFKFVQTDPKSMTRQAIFLGLPEYNIESILNQNQINNAKPWSPILLGVKINPYLKNYYSAGMHSLSRLYAGYVISDSSNVEVVAMGINKDNVNDYKYRVIENDSTEIVPWSPITLSMQHNVREPHAFFGNFKALGKQLVIEVQNIKNYGIRDGVVLDWRVNYKPILKEIKVQLPFSETQRNYYFNLKNAKMNKGYATKFVEGTEIPVDFKFPVDSVANMNLTFEHHETIPYAISVVYKEGKGDTTYVGAEVVSENFIVESKNFTRTGKYEIVVERMMEYPDGDQKLYIPFEVKPPPLGQKKVAIKQLIPYAVAILTGIAILFFLYRRQSRAKLQRVAQQKEIVGLKLQSIRSQLNPHFMFNALTSIQNLINKNNISGANYYLSKFAGLTRQVLDGSNEELISLEDELKMLNDYLQMEQLRFNFKYEFNVYEQLNQANIEIPAMLLQPFVENAIKHGIAGLNEEGKIDIIVSAESKDLVLIVNDNGAGFTKENKGNGYGIKLSEDRVVLLNQIYKDQTVTLIINSAQRGTSVGIRLSNWI